MTMNAKKSLPRILTLLACLSLACSLFSSFLPGGGAASTPTSFALPSGGQSGVSVQGSIFQDDFEGAQSAAWNLDPGWQVVADGGNHVLSGEGHVWARTSQAFDGDLRQSLRIKLLQGRIHIVLRLSDASRYFIGFDASGSDLNKQYFPSDFRENLANQSAAHELNRWYQVEIALQEDKIAFSVDGTPQWTYADSEPLKNGSLAFETLDNSQVYVDDIAINPVSTQITSASVPTAAPVPTTGVVPTTAAELPSEVKIGIVYPITGRLADVNEWGPEGKSFWEAAEKDINQLPEATAGGVHFKLVVRSSASTGEGALAAVQDLVQNEGVQAIAGLPSSGEIQGAIPYLTEHRIAAISSASTGPLPQLMQPDTVYRIMPTELYMARKLADLAMEQGYTRAAAIYRTDGWGDRYGPEFTARFEAKGYPTQQVSIVPTHPKVGDYAAEVSELSRRVAQLGADEHTVVLLAVWEGEDLNILHHAAADSTLSAVRWLAALSGPSILSGHFGPDEDPTSIKFPDAPSFAYSHRLWSQENHPAPNELVTRLWLQATRELGREPRFEHVYVYDAVQLIARAILLAGTLDGATIAARIPDAAHQYQPATGIIRFDQNGDRSSGDLDYFGLYQGGGTYEYRYYAYFHDDAWGGRFEILSSPAIRTTRFCPEC
jgi:ABC-type branched-subunit amino acid transport system substrate-binding protein